MTHTVLSLRETTNKLSHTRRPVTCEMFTICMCDAHFVIIHSALLPLTVGDIVADVINVINIPRGASSEEAVKETTFPVWNFVASHVMLTVLPARQLFPAGVGTIGVDAALKKY